LQKPRKQVLVALAAIFLLVGVFEYPFSPNRAVGTVVQNTLVTITVGVADPQGLALDGALITVTNTNTSAVMAQGRTSGGSFMTTVPPSNSTYSISASSAVQTKAQKFLPYTGAVLNFNFTLLRSLPVTQVVLSAVNLTPDPTWSTVAGQFTVTNSGQTNVTVSSIAFNSSSSSPLTVLGSGSRFFLGAISSGLDHMINVNFAVQPKSAQGVYSIGYTLYYTDSFGRNYTAPGSFAFNLNRNVGTSELVIASVAYDLVTTGTGYTVAARFTVANVGLADVTASSIQFNSSSPLAVLGSGSKFSIGPVVSRSNRTATVNFAIQPSAKQGLYSIPYTLAYTDSYGRNYSSNGNFGFNLNRTVGSSELTIATITYVLQRTGSGYTVGAKFVISNVGQVDISASTLKFNSSSPLTVLGSGSTFAIGGIKAGTNKTLPVNFVVQTKSGQGVYSVPYVLNFTDALGRSSLITGTTSFLINGIPNVKIASIVPSSTRIVPGNDANVDIHLTNIGDGTATDVTVAIAGMSHVISTNSSFIGILAPSSNSSTTFGLNFPASFSSGTSTLAITIGYKDVTGKTYTDYETYFINLFPRDQPLVKVQNILTDPVVLTAGTNGLMTIYLVNIGGDQADNILAQVSGAQDILTSQVFNIGSIKPNDTASTILGVNVNPSIASGVHLLPIQLTYTNPLGQSFNQSSFLEVTIYSQPSLFTPINDGIMAGAVVSIVAAIVVARRLNIRI